MTKISVITPIIENDLKYFEIIYNQLKEQLFTDFQWIIVKDGDFDIPHFTSDEKKFPISVVNNELGQGVASARNTGIDNASGEYIYFYDCDDLITKHTLFCLHETSTNGNAEIIIGSFKNISKKPDISISYQTLFDRVLKNRDIQTKEATAKNLRSSSLNILFKREFILNNGIQFNSELELYADMPFNFESYSKANTILYDQDAIYLKMSRNDPINHPSLIQKHEQELVGALPIAYNHALQVAEKDELKTVLGNRIIKTYYYKYIRRIYEGYKVGDRQVLEAWATTLHNVDRKVINKQKRTARLEINALIKKKYKKAMNIVNLRILFNNIKGIKGDIIKRNIFLYERMFKKIPLKDNVIVYESFLGRNYSDSPKYIHEYLQSNYGKKYKHIWVFEDDTLEFDLVINKVRRFSLKHFYYLARSKYIVNNMRLPLWFSKRKGQVFLQTWHGTPLKKLGVDIEEIHMPGTTTEKYKRNFVTETSRWDYLVSANRYSSDIFRRAFVFKNEMLEYGYPRNDILYKEDKDTYSKRIKERLGIPLDKKIVLYAPTWRDDEFYGKGQYKFTLKLDLHRLKNELGDEYFFLLRTHYLIAENLDLEGLEDVVYNASNYNDIGDLYLLSDVLITDYSSVFFDYANLKRPILFYAYDLDKYKDTLRGFYLKHDTEWPGPILQTNDEVIKTLKNLEEEYAPYVSRLDEFYQTYCKWDDGNASKNIAEHVIVNSSK